MLQGAVLNADIPAGLWQVAADQQFQMSTTLLQSRRKFGACRKNYTIPKPLNPKPLNRAVWNAEQVGPQSMPPFLV